MGTTATRIITFLTKPLRDYNIEGRAHKVISKDKPKVAPKYKSDQMSYEQLMKEYPDVYEQSKMKNDQLDKHLKGVYVKSYDSPENIQTNPNRPLPMNRGIVEDSDYGANEPETVPEGKVSLKQALQFITNHHLDKKTNSVENIAKEYRLAEGVVKDVVTYFRAFEVYVPKVRNKANLAGPVVPKVRIVRNALKQIEPAKKNKKEQT